MNRPIKFRAWDKSQKIMRPINHGITLYCEDNYKDTILEIEEAFEWQDEIHELMQFTGLLDATEQEIYEGDIVKNKYNNLVVVTFDEEGYWHPFTSGASCGCCGEFTDWYSQEDRKIVGNIFENPDLNPDGELLLPVNFNDGNSQ